MTGKRKSLFQRTEDAANAAQNAQRGGGNGIIGLQQAGARRQARSNSEALGMGFREFILPMIIQGAMDWKANYNARGDFKATGAELLDRLIAGDQLSAQEQSILDNYQKRYSKEYADAMAAAQTRAQQPAPQSEQPAAPANNPISSALKDYVKQNIMPNVDGADFFRHASYPDAAYNDSPVTAGAFQDAQPAAQELTGANLAQEAEDRLRNALGGEPKGWLLNALTYGR